LLAHAEDDPESVGTSDITTKV